MKQVIGWILFLVGLAGIIANIIFIVTSGTSSWTLLANTLFCLVFIFGGWRLAHPPGTKSSGMLR